MVVSRLSWPSSCCGSLIYKDEVPAVDTLLVERLRDAGAITVGKTNTPEFGAGSQTFNAVFGPTRNPYDLTRTCGGSSGGAAVALACGMVPLADGYAFEQATEWWKRRPITSEEADRPCE